jgi:hypothetical protein
VHVAESAVGIMTDQSTIAGVARNAFYPVVRKAAVMKLNDLVILREILNNDTSNLVKETALKRIRKLK